MLTEAFLEEKKNTIISAEAEIVKPITVIMMKTYETIIYIELHGCSTEPHFLYFMLLPPSQQRAYHREILQMKMVRDKYICSVYVYLDVRSIWMAAHL